MIALAPPSRACGPAGSSVSSLVGELSGFFLGSAPCRPSVSSARRRLLLSTPSSTTPRHGFHSTPSRDSSAPSRISYRIAASSSGKGRPFVPAKNAYNFFPDRQDALGVAPEVTDPALRRKRRPDSGEDAFFVSRVGHSPQNQGAVAFAVADGVGGWSESRVDPADFSHALCNYMAESALEWDAPVEQLRAKQLLQAGYDRVVADKSIRAGGSTASVGVGLEDGRVELANLGDSGSVLLRLAAVHHYSTPQTHGFNTPYQLSIIPPRMRAQASIFGGAFLEDFPRDAAVTSLQMQHGDVLMLATDGVYDNLNNQDILKLVTSRMVLTGAWDATPELGIRPSDQLDQLTGPVGLSALLPAGTPSPMGDQPYTLQSFLASSIAGEAKLASVDIRRDGPFAKEAQRYYPGDYYRGGKIDDICVLAIVAVDESQTGPKAGGRESRL